MRLTQFITLGALIVVLVYDLIRVLIDGHYNATVSQFIHQTSKEWVIVAESAEYEKFADKLLELLEAA